MTAPQPPRGSPLTRTAVLILLLAVTLCLMTLIVLVLFGPLLTE